MDHSCLGRTGCESRAERTGCVSGALLVYPMAVRRTDAVRSAIASSSYFVANPRDCNYGAEAALDDGAAVVAEGVEHRWVAATRTLIDSDEPADRRAAGSRRRSLGREETRGRARGVHLAAAHNGQVESRRVRLSEQHGACSAGAAALARASTDRSRRTSPETGHGRRRTDESSTVDP